MTKEKTENPRITEILAIIDRYCSGEEKALEELENYGEGVCLFSEAKGRVILNNEGLDQMFGYEPGEIVALEDSLVAFPSFSRDLNLNTIAIQIFENGFWIGEAPYLRKSGQIFYCQTAIIPFEHPKFHSVWLVLHTEIQGKTVSQAGVH